MSERGDVHSARGLADQRPLALRLPRPPRALVGREAELAQLRELLGQPGSVLVSGAAGAGKSLLALTALQGMQGVVRVQGRALLPGGLVPQIRRLLQLGPAIAPDWRLLDANPEEALVALVEWADRGDWVLWLDGLDAIPDEELSPVLDAADAWAQASRWLVTRRRAPVARVGRGRELALGPMESEALGALIPSEFRAMSEEILREAEGMPGQVLQAMALRSISERDDDGRALETIRKTLALLRRPMRPDVLRSLGVDAGSALLRQLQALGEVALLPEGLLWQSAGEERVQGEADRRHVAEVAASLREHPGDTEALLEALRLLLSIQDWKGALELLQAHGDALGETGRAVDMLSLLEESAATVELRPELQDWLDWCAWESGRVAEAATAAPRDTFRQRYLAMRMAIARGAFGEALERFGEAQRMTGDPGDLERLRVRAARALFSMGRREDCLEMLAGTDLVSDWGRTESEIMRAECAAIAGEREEATRHVRRIKERVPELAPHLRLRAFLGISRVQLISEELREAEATLQTLLRSEAERCGDSVSGRSALELAATVALMRGNLDELDRLLERILPGRARARSIFLEAYRLNAGLWRWSAARFGEELAALARDVAAEASPMAAEIMAFLAELRLRFAWLMGVPAATLGTLPEPATGPIRTTPEAGALQAGEDARWGAPLPEPAPAAGTRQRIILMQPRLMALLYRGTCGPATRRDEALAEGLRGAEEAIAAAQEYGYRLEEVAHLRIALHFAWGRGEDTNTSALRARLRSLATHMGAEPLLAELGWWDALGEQRPPSSGTLEGWGASEQTAPALQRWAAWLLGEDVPLDPVEAALLGEQAARPGWRRARIIAPARTERPLLAADADGALTLRGLDTERAEIWSRDGGGLQLARSPLLLRFLEVLCERGGRASKEELVLAVWQEREYHPLRHDNRLRLAARNLRRRFSEVGLGEPLETEEDGYALRGTWRLR